METAKNFVADQTKQGSKGKKTRPQEALAKVHLPLSAPVSVLTLHPSKKLYQSHLCVQVRFMLHMLSVSFPNRQSLVPPLTCVSMTAQRL